MPAARYRLLTQLRGHAPDWLAARLPYPEDCGDHDWYRISDEADGCRYCLTERPHVIEPITVGSTEWDGLLAAAEAGSAASADALASRIEETERAAREAAHEATHRILQGLSRQEREIVLLRLGQAGKPPLTLDKVAERIEVTDEASRAFVTDLLRRLNSVEDPAKRSLPL